MSRSMIRSASAKPFSMSPNVNVSAASAFDGNLPWSTSAMSAAVHFNVRMLGPTNTLPCSRPFGDPGRRPCERIDHVRQRFEGDDDAIDRFGGELFAVCGDGENRLALVDRFLRQREFRGHRRRGWRGRLAASRGPSECRLAAARPARRRQRRRQRPMPSSAAADYQCYQPSSQAVAAFSLLGRRRGRRRAARVAAAAPADRRR